MTSTRYDRRKGTSSRGQIYETKMTALVAMRLFNNFDQFHVAINLHAGGQFDDIVFSAEKEQKWNTYFVQLKHKENKIGIPLEKLYSQPIVDTTDKRKKKHKRNGFCLTMYFKSYNKIQQKFKEASVPIFCHPLSSAKFYLFTNGLLADDVLKLKHPQEHIGLLSTNASSEVNFKLCCERDAKLIQKFEKEGAHYVKQFVDQFYFCSGQVDESNVDKLVDDEIKEKRDLTTNEVNILRLKLYEFVDRKSVGLEGLYITEKVINNFFTETNFQAQSDKKGEDNIKFTQPFLNELLNRLSDNTQLTLLKCWADTTLICMAALRQLQLLDHPNLTITSQQYLEDDNKFDNLMSIWELEEQRTMIIDLKNDWNYELVAKWLRILCKTNPENRILMVAAEDNIAAAKLAEKLNAKDKYFECYSQNLAEESLERMLQCKFQFQDCETSLNKLFSNSEQLNDILDIDTMEGLLTGKRIEVGIKYQEPIAYYVPRTLKRNTISQVIFSNAPTGNIFAVSGVTMDELKRIPFFQNIEIDTSSNIVLNEEGSPTKKIYILDGIDHQLEFNKLLRTPHVHWLQGHKRSNKYVWYWQQSTGNIKLILDNLSNNYFEYLTSDNIMGKDVKLAVLSAESGMGKTVLLNNLALQAKKCCPQMWVVPVKLRDFSDDFDDENFSKDVKRNVKNIIAKAAGIGNSSSTFSVKLFDHFYDVTGNMTVLLDGFDEITPFYYKEGIQVLNTLKKSLVARTIVTTRPVWETQLQLEVSILCFFIQPFGENEQNKFITCYCANKVMSDRRKDVMSFINIVTKQIPSSFGKDTNEFKGNPFHLKMIIEAYDQAKTIPLQLNGLQLFEKVVNEKLEVVIKEKLQKTSTSVVLKSWKADWLQKCKTKLMQLALLTIFPQKTCSTLHPSINSDEYEELQKFVEHGEESSGFVSSFKGTTPHFIHGLYAEYFIAQFFAQHFKTNRKFLESEKTFFSKSFLSVRDFFNYTLAIGKKLHESVLQRNISFIEEDIKKGLNERDKAGRTALHVAAAQPNSKKEIEILLKAGADANIVDKMLKWKAVDYAIRLKHFTNIGPLLEVSQPTSTVDDIVPTTWESLRMAISGDYKELLLYLIENNIIPKVSEPGTQYLINKNWLNTNSKDQKLTLLHVAAWYNASKILEYCLNADNMDYRSQIECHDDRQRTPLLLAVSNQSIEAVAILIKAGANLRERTEEKKDILRLTIELHDTEMFVWILMAMKSQQLKIETYLTEAIGLLIGDKSPWALQMLQSFLFLYPELKNATMKKGVPLITAASIKGNEEAVVVLSEIVDVNIVYKSWTPLHFAARYGHIEVVKVLLQCPGINPNVVDQKGNTPYDLVNLKKHATIADLLIKHIKNKS